MSTLTRDGYQLVVDSGLRTRRDLAAILPPKVAAKAQREHLADGYAAGALRLLAVVPESLWAEAVSSIHIDFDALLESVRKERSDDRTRLVFELAALLYGRQYMPYDVVPRFLKYVDDEDLLAGFDAMRIAREGLEP